MGEELEVLRERIKCEIVQHCEVSGVECGRISIPHILPGASEPPVSYYASELRQEVFQ